MWHRSVSSIPKAALPTALDEAITMDLGDDRSEAALAQMSAARTAALTLAEIIPGPKLHVMLAGHGDGDPEGALNNQSDEIRVTVTQVLET